MVGVYSIANEYSFFLSFNWEIWSSFKMLSFLMLGSQEALFAMCCSGVAVLGVFKLVNILSMIEICISGKCVYIG